jgi:hypothetical protein
VLDTSNKNKYFEFDRILYNLPAKYGYEATIYTGHTCPSNLSFSAQFPEDE